MIGLAFGEMACLGGYIQDQGGYPQNGPKKTPLEGQQTKRVP